MDIVLTMAAGSSHQLSKSSTRHRATTSNRRPAEGWSHLWVWGRGGDQSWFCCSLSVVVSSRPLCCLCSTSLSVSVALGGWLLQRKSLSLAACFSSWGFACCFSASLCWLVNCVRRRACSCCVFWKYWVVSACRGRPTTPLCEMGYCSADAQWLNHETRGCGSSHCPVSLPRLIISETCCVNGSFNADGSVYVFTIKHLRPLSRSLTPYFTLVC